MNIVLIGYRGCGKSTVGRKLAEALWMDYVDLDEEIARQAKRPVSELFSHVGAEEYGQIESYVMAEIAGRSGQVIGVGGRTLMTAVNIATLKNCGECKMVYLKAEPAALFRRLAGRERSPNYQDTLEEIQQLLAEREPVYKSASDVTVDTTHMDADRVVKHICQMI